VNRRRHSQRGQTTVEFALILPALFLFLFGIFQVGGAYFNKEALQTSARDGARAASIHTGDTWANIQADAIAAVKANATGLTWSKVTTSVTCSTATCGTGDVVTVTLTYPWKLGVYTFSTSGTLSTSTQLRME
jgi:Flp pilus assembly protein TadG